MNPEKRYKFSAICFGLAAIAFLAAGILGGFKIPFFVLTVLFTVNSILFFSLGKKNANKVDTKCDNTYKK